MIPRSYRGSTVHRLEFSLKRRLGTGRKKILQKLSACKDHQSSLNYRFNISIIMRSYFFVILSLFAVLALAYGETTCQTHKRNSARSGHGMKWNIQCDPQGHYLPLQCTDDIESKKWCACYNKEEAITGPSRKVRQCQCPLAKDRATNSNAKECDIPKCDNTGKFEAKQCCPSTGKCRCVNRNTGETTTQPTSDRNLHCS